jgi:hypothetical protein
MKHSTPRRHPASAAALGSWAFAAAFRRGWIRDGLAGPRPAVVIPIAPYLNRSKGTKR